MRHFLAALLLATLPADAAESAQWRVRADVWEVGNAAWATAMDTMESPAVWRQSLLLDPGSRLAGSWVLSQIELSEVKLLGFASFGSNPFAMPQAEFHRFSVSVTRSVRAGRWEILAAQEAPPTGDGTRSGSQRVVLVHCDLSP